MNKINTLLIALCIILIGGVSLTAQTVMFSLVPNGTGDGVCLQATPDMTFTGCIGGGNLVILVPDAANVTIEAADITNTTGTWVIGVDQAFMGHTVYQFDSNDISNINFMAGVPFVLFCIAIDVADGECIADVIRLQNQVDHNNPDPDENSIDHMIYDLGVQHTMQVSTDCASFDGTAYNGNVAGEADEPCPELPIELLSFNATATANAIDLNWLSASEVDFDGYTLERSTDGKSFEKIEWVAGAGSEFEQQRYNYLDQSVKGGVTYYYRLQLVDLDGSFEYSDIASAKLASDDKVAVYPNPAQSELTVDITATTQDDVNVRLYDATGKVAYERVLSLEEGTNVLKLNVANMPTGLYRLVVNGQQIRTAKDVVIVE